MQTRRVRGRKYSDPDLITLIDAAESIPDLYDFVEREAETLLARLAAFDTQFDNGFERICIVASIAGFEVRPMEIVSSRKNERDAVLVPTQSPGRRGLILYNPERPQTRIVHSIAHEIAHSFFPNSGEGAQFRSLHRVGGKVPELEQLCDHGASSLTMPFAEVRRAIERYGIGLSTVDLVRAEFGTSYEAALYRMATCAANPVAAGRFCYREPKLGGRPASQQHLFDGVPEAEGSLAKYRRQAFHSSTSSYPTKLIIPWNKSLPRESVLYRAAESGRVETATEDLVVKSAVKARFQVEAVRARYQPPRSDYPEWPDVLVLFTLLN